MHQQQQVTWYFWMDQQSLYEYVAKDQKVLAIVLKGPLLVLLIEQYMWSNSLQLSRYQIQVLANKLALMPPVSCEQYQNLYYVNNREFYVANFMELQLWFPTVRRFSYCCHFVHFSRKNKITLRNKNNRFLCGLFCKAAATRDRLVNSLIDNIFQTWRYCSSTFLVHRLIKARCIITSNDHFQTVSVRLERKCGLCSKQSNLLFLGRKRKQIKYVVPFLVASWSYNILLLYLASKQNKIYFWQWRTFQLFASLYSYGTISHPTFVP